MSVLLVDDEPDVVALLRFWLERLDGRLQVVGHAHDGEEGLARWMALEPDVVVLDHQMPGMSGVELARRILATTPTQKIVMCTGHAASVRHETAGLLGVDVLDKAQLQDIPGLLRDLSFS